MGIRTFIFSATLTCFLGACAQGHCRHPAEHPPEEQSAAGGDSQGKAPTANSGTVFVYKYDGSLQCKMGKAMSVETMSKELQGLTILSSTKKPDGLMHIQVCGSITGMANVYEIPADQLKKAEARGFKKWSFE